MESYDQTQSGAKPAPRNHTNQAFETVYRGAHRFVRFLQPHFIKYTSPFYVAPRARQE
jgi:hypothetical protein